jgi:3-phenylpropionate/trans-cinnamate dioxygenase ferredoxin subunit
MPKINWIKIFDTKILQAADFVRGLEISGKRLCIVKDGEKFFATQFYCPHAGAVLADGWCKEQRLICPYHRYEYDLKTGRGAPGQGDYIDLYPTEVREDGLYVGLPEPGFLKKIFRF